MVCPWIGVWKLSNSGFQGDTLACLLFERLDGMRPDRQYWLRTLPHRLGAAFVMRGTKDTLAWLCFLSCDR